MIKDPKSLPLFPFFFALFPGFYLLALNRSEVSFQDSLRSFLVSLGLTLLILLIARTMLKDLHKAAGITALIIVLFFSYGHIYETLKGLHIDDLILGRHRYLAPLFAFIGFSGTIGILRVSHTHIKQITWGLNLVSVALLVQPVVTSSSTLLANWSANAPGPGTITQASTIATAEINPRDLPDIYFIILDAYARSDILARDFEYDNSSFLEFLTSNGFYVVPEARANYVWTTLSITSTLNLDYVSNLPVELDADTYPEALLPHLHHSLARSTLEGLGYQSLSMPSGYRPTEIQDADFYLNPDLSDYETLQMTGALNSFESLFVYTTAFRALIDMEMLQNLPIAQAVSERIEHPREAQRIFVLSALDQLSQIPAIPSPTFAFTHIISPHRPYFFGPDGEFIDDAGVFTFAETPTSDIRPLYRDQLIYITSRIEAALGDILEKSAIQPVIILQSDHGPEVRMDWEDPTPEAIQARVAVLNAILLPENCRDQFYPSLSSVNTFRIVFNCLFDRHTPLLEDNSYFNDIRGEAPFELRLIENDTFP